MWCVIPAAGRGTRMGPAGGRPKALLEIGGRLLIDHLLDRLPDVVTDVCLVVGSEGRGVRELGRTRLGRRMHYVVQPRPTGVADAAMRAADLVSGTTLVIMGDVYYEDGLAPYVEALQAGEASGGILVEKSGAAVGRDPVGLVKLEGDRVVATHKAPFTGEARYRVCGLFLLPETAWDAGREIRSDTTGEFELETLVQALIDRGHVFRAVEYTGWRRNINTPRDLRLVKRRIAEADSRIDRPRSRRDGSP